MAKQLSAKQIKFFGTKAQRASLKRRVPNGRRKVRKNSPGNRAIAGYGSTTMNPPGGGAGRVITGYGSASGQRRCRMTLASALRLHRPSGKAKRFRTY